MRSHTRRRTVGEALRILRDRANLRRLHVARATGLSIAEIRVAELGDGEIHYDTLVKFLGAIRASWQDFLFVLEGKDPEDLAAVAHDLGGALLMLAEQIRRSAG